MSVELKCISPVDGTLYAAREALSLAAARKAVAKAHAAQAEWAARPLAERIDLVRAAVAIIGQQNEDIVPELAWQMGTACSLWRRIWRLSRACQLYGRHCPAQSGAHCYRRQR